MAGIQEVNLQHDKTTHAVCTWAFWRMVAESWLPDAYRKCCKCTLNAWTAN